MQATLGWSVSSRFSRSALSALTRRSRCHDTHSLSHLARAAWFVAILRLVVAVGFVVSCCWGLACIDGREVDLGQSHGWSAIHVNQIDTGALTACSSAASLTALRFVSPEPWGRVSLRDFDAGIRRHKGANADEGLAHVYTLEAYANLGVRGRPIEPNLAAVEESLRRGHPVLVSLSRFGLPDHGVAVLEYKKGTETWLVSDPLSNTVEEWTSDSLSRALMDHQLAHVEIWWDNPMELPTQGVELSGSFEHSRREEEKHAKLTTVPFALRTALAASDPRWKAFEPEEYARFIANGSSQPLGAGVDLDQALDAFLPLGLVREQIGPERAQLRAIDGQPSLLLITKQGQPQLKVLLGWDSAARLWIVSDPLHPTLQLQTWKEVANGLANHESALLAIWTCPLDALNCVEAYSL